MEFEYKICIEYQFFRVSEIFSASSIEIGFSNNLKCDCRFSIMNLRITPAIQPSLNGGV